MNRPAGEGSPRPIGRLHHLILDCPDPRTLAAFYATLLGLPITYDSDDFVVVSLGGRFSGIAFQLSLDHVPPTFPDPHASQQMHLDVMVDDVAAAVPAVLAAGAVLLPGGDGTVFADPAGHPFCLIPLPGWADPVNPGR